MNSKLLTTRYTLLTLGGVLAALAIVTVNWSRIEYSYERRAFDRNPSAAYAMELGDRHFQSSKPYSYNIDAAEYFFTEAALRDLTYPYVYHQLARVSFLRGDFTTALERINTEIEHHGDTESNTYYVRGLIEGFKGDYDAAIADYRHYLALSPHNWAGMNDYAWVLLKANRPRDAVIALQDGLREYPNNSWLLNSYATALYEIGYFDMAKDAAQKALSAVQHINEKDWLQAYPGNDPRVAREGIQAFQKAVMHNMNSIVVATASSTVQSKK